MRKDDRPRLTPPPRVASTPGARSGDPDQGRRSGAVPSGRRVSWGLAALAMMVLGALGIAALLAGRDTGGHAPAPAAAADGQSLPAVGAGSGAASSATAAGGLPGAGPGPVGETAAGPRSPRAAREQAYLRDAAGEALARAAGLRDDLEQQGVSIWGAEGMQRAAADMAAADASFTAGRYGEARDGYDAAGAILADLIARAPLVLEQALADGEAALAAGRMTEAAAAFALALRLAPEDGRARAGLRSAESLDRVLALLNEGERHERAGRPADAEASYRQALDLDPGSQAAMTALDRVRERRRDEALSAVLSEAFSALEAGRHDAARQALQQAGRIAPGSPLVADGLARVAEAEKVERIAAHRERAAAAESSEDWRDALSEHEAALALDATLTFAQEGAQRAARRAGMQEALAAHIAGAARLGDEEVAREASALLDEARQVAPAGPRHQAQVDELSRLLAMMSRSLPVTLLSDGKTEVTVYRVGRLGAFERRNLDLRPGTYTVLGQRDGYRDVRRTLTVSPGQAPAPLEIRCEDRL